MFVRIKPEIKKNRVCVILVNYNMTENVDRLIDSLKHLTKHPTDFYVVDNGSDITKPSKYTTISLTKNIQTCNGWLMGLHYADCISLIENFKYLAYCFLITSLYIDDDKDIISVLIDKMINDDDIVGIAPSLSPDSTTAHKHLYNQGNNKLRSVKFIDNLCSLYRADWFNDIGRFNPEMTYAWAIDIETGYLARKNNYDIYIDDSITIKKISDIGYKMDRMNMSANDRSLNARSQMNNYLSEKYGNDWVEIIK